MIHFPHCKSLLLLVLLVTIKGPLFAQNLFNDNFNLAVEAIQQKQYKKAISLFDQAIKHKDLASNDYKVARAYIGKSNANLYLGNPKEAIAEIDKGIQIKPEFGDLYSAKAGCYVAQKQYKAAINALRIGRKLKPESIEILAFMADCAYKDKQYKNGSAICDTILQLNPMFTRGLSLKGAFLSRLKDYKGADVYFTKAISIDPTKVIPYYDRGISRSYDGRLDLAYEDMNKAMNMDTTDLKWVGYNNIAFFIYLKREQYQAAIDYFNIAMKYLKDKSISAPLNNRGYAKFKLGDIEGGLKDINDALKMEPSNSFAYRNLALVYLHQGKSEKACQSLMKAKELDFTIDYGDEIDELIQKQGCANNGVSLEKTKN